MSPQEAFETFTTGTPVIFINAANKAKRGEVVEVGYFDETNDLRVKIEYPGLNGARYTCCIHVDRVGTLDAFGK